MDDLQGFTQLLADRGIANNNSCQKFLNNLIPPVCDAEMKQVCQRTCGLCTTA